MKIKFKRQIRVCVRQECFGDEWGVAQEWEFDEGEELEVRKLVYSEYKYKKGRKPARMVKFADIYLFDGSDIFPDYIHLVNTEYFEVLS